MYLVYLREKKKAYQNDRSRRNAAINRILGEAAAIVSIT